MKRGTPDHPKTLALMDSLACPKPMAVGLLELLWHFTSRYAPQGDIGRWSDANIASGVCWPGDPETLVRALVSSGWIDEHSKHRLVVHDWHDHADDATKKHIQRNDLRFVMEPRKRPTRGETSRDKSRQVPPAVAVAVAVAKPDGIGADPDPSRPRVVVVDGLTGKPSEWDGGPWFPTRESRRAAESEALRLAQQAGKLHDTDPPDEMARAASYPGARLRKVNPATMTHDRLVNTLAALRERCGLARQEEDAPRFDAYKRAGLA